MHNYMFSLPYPLCCDKTLSLFVTHLLCFSALWIQNQYEKHKEVSTAQGVKILGKDLEKTLAGLPLLVAHKEDEIPVLRVTYFTN